MTLRFFFIDAQVPAETRDLLASACAARGIAFHAVDAWRFKHASRVLLRPGDMLYRAGTTFAATQVEQWLHRPGVATFHADADGPLFGYEHAPLLFQRAGLPMPRWLPLQSAAPDDLRSVVDLLGGLPLVVKVGGSEGGVGTMRADSLPALASLADYLLAQGTAARLCAYVPDALHWRVVVVGDRAVAAYPNPLGPDGFRSRGTDDAAACTASPAPDLAALAVAATRALRLEFAGVDILAHPSGRLYLLEANFPCYYPHAELLAGIPIAATMVAHLVAKAERSIASKAHTPNHAN